MSASFSKILIANRGEIACRVIRTAQAEGYRTVAVYSDADADALHVEMADESVRIGPAPATESYLSIDAILQAAKQSGAQAVHPGYGFLSENAAFARACAEAGLVFIGPSADAIRLMGNKAEAKRRMVEAGVPCVPGYSGDAQDDETLESEASRIGFPVFLKAAAGGGGRGMRRVNSAGEMDEALAGARSEARNAFGSDELIIEKYVENARHVEIQILADSQGACIHLGERDCSVQRRNQKIVEESPCPVMTDKLRDAMGDAAVKVAKAAGYVNAGTVEFLLDSSGNFYFLEMNTRLQVEHPVTEMVTGLDLVRLQFEIAQGRPLPLTQGDVELNGHAIEARIYAEAADAGFLPQTGTVRHWSVPRAPGIRVDHGLRTGMEITSYYDPMIAKIIAYGTTREEARARLTAALENVQLFGVLTNIPFLSKLLESPVFVSGEATTAFVETSDLLSIEEEKPSLSQLSIAAAVLVEHATKDLPKSVKGWRSTGPATMPIRMLRKEKVHALYVSMLGDEYTVSLDDDSVEFRVEAFAGESISWISGGVRRLAHCAIEGEQVFLHIDGRTLEFVDVTYAPPESSAATGDGVLKAPMAGQIVRLNAAEGDKVTRDQVLVVVEAMKMENQVVAPGDGTVESISVAVGQQVDANQVLLTLTIEGQANEND